MYGLGCQALPRPVGVWWVWPEEEAMAEAYHGAPVHGSAPGAHITARLDPNTPDRPQEFCLIVDMTLDPGLHVYGLPIPAGFLPLAIEVTPAPGLVVGKAAFPPPILHHMEGLDEDFFIYEGTLCVVLPVTVSATPHAAALDMQVRYQACGEMGCFMPQTVALCLPLPG